jgi:hypothetical protein
MERWLISEVASLFCSAVSPKWCIIGVSSRAATVKYQVPSLCWICRAKCVETLALLLPSQDFPLNEATVGDQKYYSNKRNKELEGD